VLVAMNYFTKWVEVASHAKVTSKHTAKFIIKNIICQYGVQHELTSDQRSHFMKEVASLFENYKSLLHIDHRQIDLSKQLTRIYGE